MSKNDYGEAKELALSFARALGDRDYPRAHAMTAAAYRKSNPVDRLKKNFEAIVPLDWGPVRSELVEVGTLLDWPDKQRGDVARLYVSISGQSAPYSEAISVIVAMENGKPCVREVEFGRP